MNRLPIEKRTLAIQLLCEGVSMRATSRIVKCSINTVSKLLADTAIAAANWHDESVVEVPAQRVQVDEAWGFCYAKKKNVEHALAAPEEAGDIWTWVAIDADTKLIISTYVGDRSGASAIELLDDLSRRLLDRVQLTSDGHSAYLEAVEGAFGSNIDYAMLQKHYSGLTVDESGTYKLPRCVGAHKEVVMGNPNPDHINTSYIERQNLTLRMHQRRMTRLTNAFSKKFLNHCYAVALYQTWFNWIRPHKSLGGETPAMAAGLASAPMSYDWLASLADDALAPKPRGPYRPRISN